MSNLPRLAVVSDVPVDRTASGNLLIYRLLSEWPVDRLLIIDGSLIPREPGRELPAVEYQTIHYTLPRFHRSRLRVHANGLLAWTIQLTQNRIRRHLVAFQADAVLSVAHGHMWGVAARVARRLGLPFHIICHDDLSATTPCADWARTAVENSFGAAYRSASSRLCVCPGMAAEYERRYGANGLILYPSRGDDSPATQVRARVRNRGLVVGYAGSLFAPGCLDQLIALASALDAINGRVLLFTREFPRQLLDRGNICHGGFVPAADLAHQLGEMADVLFVPMSFHKSEQTTVSTAFPSKLADYTAIGLPLLIQGPHHCSAVRWACDHPGIAEIVTDESPANLDEALRRLASDPIGRREMAQRGIEAGEKCFSLARARRVFYTAMGHRAYSDLV